MENPSKGIPSRTKPVVWKALLIYAVYLAIFYGVWALTKVDYEQIGTTVQNTKEWYAYPTLAGGLSIVILVSLFGWWRGSLFEKVKAKARYVYIVPILMILFSVLTLAKYNYSEIPSSIYLWVILGGIGVGFGEEMITRGSMIFGLRSKFSETKVWLFSTLLFSALHLPNIIFGLRASGLVSQLVFTFIIGSGLYMTRRVSGSLFLPIFAHGLWDSATFLGKPIDMSPTVLMVLIYPITLVILVVFLVGQHKQRKAHVAEKQEQLTE